MVSMESGQASAYIFPEAKQHLNHLAVRSQVTSQVGILTVGKPLQPQDFKDGNREGSILLNAELMPEGYILFPRDSSAFHCPGAEATQVSVHTHIHMCTQRERDTTHTHTHTRQELNTSNNARTHPSSLHIVILVQLQTEFSFVA